MDRRPPPPPCHTMPTGGKLQSEHRLGRERPPSPGPGVPAVTQVSGPGVGALGEEVTELVPMITFTFQLPILGLQRTFILTIILVHIITMDWVETARPILERIKLRARKVTGLAQWLYWLWTLLSRLSTIPHCPCLWRQGGRRGKGTRTATSPFPAGTIDPVS